MTTSSLRTARAVLAPVALALSLALGPGTGQATKFEFSIGIGPGWHAAPGGIYIGPRGVRLTPWVQPGWYVHGGYYYYQPANWTRYCSVPADQVGWHGWHHIHTQAVPGIGSHSHVEAHQHPHWNHPSILYLRPC